ncbi:hypothetical protein ACIP97_13780 [Peribacillus frigoritolerans]|uniref:hypothetical protein n=1 Tax=Peribacillus frigoritolerans TaxID=450367 RepID=UPI0037F20D84
MKFITKLCGKLACVVRIGRNVSAYKPEMVFPLELRKFTFTWLFIESCLFVEFQRKH